MNGEETHGGKFAKNRTGLPSLITIVWHGASWRARMSTQPWNMNMEMSPTLHSGPISDWERRLSVLPSYLAHNG
jgi:hypothetical protein